MLWELAKTNRLIFSEKVSIPSENDQCDGCGLFHRELKYVFWQLDANGNVQDKVLMMGCVCGEKVRCFIQVVKLLNSMPFIDPGLLFYDTNLLTLLNYWTDRLLVANRNSFNSADDDKDSESTLESRVAPLLQNFPSGQSTIDPLTSSLSTTTSTTSDEVGFTDKVGTVTFTDTFSSSNTTVTKEQLLTSEK